LANIINYRLFPLIRMRLCFYSKRR